MHPIATALRFIPLVAGLLLCFACTSEDEQREQRARQGSDTGWATEAPVVQTLRFGVYTSDSATEMVKQFSPVLGAIDSALTARFGRPFKTELVVSSTYEGGVNQLVEGKVDFGRLGPASYVMASDLASDIEILALESKKGKKVFRGVVCVHRDSPITRLEGLKGKQFAFGNERSTIGRYLIQQLLVEAGITASDLAGFEYLGRHDKVGMAVGRERFHAGALKEGTFKKLRKANEPIRALVYFDNVTKPWVARPGLDSEVLKALRTTLLELRSPEALAALKKEGFLSGGDADYDSIRKAILASQEFHD